MTRWWPLRRVITSNLWGWRVSRLMLRRSMPEEEEEEEESRARGHQ